MQFSHRFVATVLITTTYISALQPLAYAQIIAAPDGTNTQSNLTGNTFTITGGTPIGTNLFHSFQQFGLNPDQIARFTHQGAQNILTRVTGGSASVIHGRIEVTGRLTNFYLMNPAGIIFGAGASLNVPGSFTATTANGIGFGNGWFNAIGSNDYANVIGNPNSFAFTMQQPGAIVNAGNLAVTQGQSITLLGGTVINTGTLSAPGGKITIAAVPGEKLVNLSQDGSLLSLALPVETGTTVNTLPFTPLSLPQLLTGGNLNNATGVTVENGAIKLTGSGVTVPSESGTAIVSNTVNTSGTTGGTVHVLGNKVGLVNATIDASGTNGGGVVLVGGDYKGQGIVPNAQQTYVSRDSAITVDAVQSGNGGRAIIWSDGTTRFYGEITARGGNQSGNGGFVEVSGKQTLSFDGNVTTSANSGVQGQLLLDPASVRIVDFDTDGVQLNDGIILASENLGEPFFISAQRIKDTLISGNVQISATEEIIISNWVGISSSENSDRNGLTLTAPTIDVEASISSGGGNIELNGTVQVRSGINISSDGGTITFNGPTQLLVSSVDSSQRIVSIRASQESEVATAFGNIIFNGGIQGVTQGSGSVELEVSGRTITAQDINVDSLRLTAADTITVKNITTAPQNGSVGEGHVRINSTRGRIEVGHINTSAANNDINTSAPNNLRGRVEIRTGQGDIVVNTIQSGHGGIEIVTPGLFRAVDSFPFSVNPRFTDLSEAEQNLVADLAEEQGISREQLTDPNAPFTIDRIQRPVSIIAYAKEEDDGTGPSITRPLPVIQITHGGNPVEPIEPTGNISIIGMRNGTQNFVVGPVVEEEGRFVLSRAGNSFTIQEVGTRTRPLTPDELPDRVSGTPGAIVIAITQTNQRVLASLESRNFVPRPPDPPIPRPPDPPIPRPPDPPVPLPPDPPVPLPPDAPIPRPPDPPIPRPPDPPIPTPPGDQPTNPGGTTNTGGSTTSPGGTTNTGGSTTSPGGTTNASGVTNSTVENQVNFSNEAGQVLNKQEQNANCVATSPIASAAGTGGDHSASSTTDTPCIPIGSGGTADDVQILKLLDGGVK